MMTENKIDLIIEIIRDVTNNHNEDITSETQAMSIEGWDSLAQLNIVFSIESEFDITIELGDMENFKTVFDFANFVEKNS